MSIADDLLKRIEAFLADSPMSERAFGIQVAGNHKFVARLRAGCGITTDTADRALALIDGRPLPPPARRRATTSGAAA